MLGVADWVQYRVEWLRTALPWTRNRFPCANTYTYLCAHLDVNELNKCIGEFFGELYQWPVQPETVSAATSESASRMRLDETERPSLVRGQEHWALDGKSLRGTRRAGAAPKETQSALGLYSTTRNYMVRQIPIRGKGHEREAGMGLLSQMNLQGVVVSADALHTQPNWCQQVLNQEMGDIPDHCQAESIHPTYRYCLAL